MIFKLCFDEPHEDGDGKRKTTNLKFKWGEGTEILAHFGTFCVVMSKQGSVLILPESVRETISGMTGEEDRVITPYGVSLGEEAYEEAFDKLLKLSLDYYSKDDIKNVKEDPALGQRQIQCSHRWMLNGIDWENSAASLTCAACGVDATEQNGTICLT